MGIWVIGRIGRGVTLTLQPFDPSTSSGEPSSGQAPSTEGGSCGGLGDSQDWGGGRALRWGLLRTTVASTAPDPPPNLDGRRDGLPLRLWLCTLPGMGSRPVSSTGQALRGNDGGGGFGTAQGLSIVEIGSYVAVRPELGSPELVEGSKAPIVVRQAHHERTLERPWESGSAFAIERGPH